MKKLLVICGPTAIGKTTLALRIAKEFKGEIVSADSRQVYKGMDIGTGKGLPVNSKIRTKNSKLGGYYEVEGVKIWGYDLVEPTCEFSVAQYVKIADKIIKDIGKRKKLPILVGGTGLYIKAVVDGITTTDVPKNSRLRRSLEKKGVKELFEILTKLDPIKSASLNRSDRKNPARLIRAIEIGEWIRRGGKLKKEKAKYEKEEVLFIGFRAKRKYLNNLIEKRVEKRLKIGFEKEVKNLLSTGVLWKHQSMQALGYRQWKDAVDKPGVEINATEEWTKDELKYAKRQMTWFKRDRRIKWFNIDKKGHEKKVGKLVNSWYSS